MRMAFINLPQIKSFFKMLWQTVIDFIDDNVLRMSAALAYYTVFSLGPILILVISLIETIYGTDAIEGKIYGQIASIVGHEAALQIQNIIARTAIEGKSYFATVLSIFILVFTATTVFGEVQDSINSIWRLKAKPKKGWLKILVNRLLSFSMIIILGFLLLVSLVLNAVVDVLLNKILQLFPELSQVLVNAVNLGSVFIVSSVLFAIIFKVLPDAKIRWKHVITGAMVTSLLFLLGKWGISLYLSSGKISTTYGAAGSLVLVLVWVYYSAIILYFGAEFTRNYAQWRGSRIYPNDYAVWIEKVEVESRKKLHDTGKVIIEDGDKNAEEIVDKIHSMREQHQE